VGRYVCAGWRSCNFVHGTAVSQFVDAEFSKNLSRDRQFDNIGGLKPKAAVKSAGVVVGRVDSIAFDDKSFRAKVTLALEKRYVFPKDSSLKILTSGLLGDQYLGIEAGADENNLAAGDVVSSTQSAIVLENLISQFLFSKAADAAPPENSNK